MFGRLVSIAFICLLFHQTKASTQFTFDTCCQDSDCAPPRECTFVRFTETFEAGPCRPGEQCICTQGESGAVPCVVDLECLEGDVCQPSGPRDTCISPCFLAGRGQRELTEAEQAVCDEQPDIPEVCPGDPATPSEPPGETPAGDGLNGDPCETTSDCRPPRMCLSLDATFRECETGEECQCRRQAPPTPSPSSQPFTGESVEPSVDEQPTESEEEGEGLASPAPDSLDPREPAPTPMESPLIEVSSPPPVEVAVAAPTPDPVEAPPTPEVTETPEPTTAVCVAVEELEGVQKVFEQDYHAWVLCDTTGSCATPGHMVMWNGAGMMMKSYCGIVGCERKVMAVNSPRWGAGAISAKTKGLAYTSFAARWESRAEERVLAAVVRLAV